MFLISKKHGSSLCLTSYLLWNWDPPKTDDPECSCFWRLMIRPWTAQQMGKEVFSYRHLLLTTGYTGMPVRYVIIPFDTHCCQMTTDEIWNCILGDGRGEMYDTKRIWSLGLWRLRAQEGGHCHLKTLFRKWDKACALNHYTYRPHTHNRVKTERWKPGRRQGQGHLYTPGE